MDVIVRSDLQLVTSVLVVSVWAGTTSSQFAYAFSISFSDFNQISTLANSSLNFALIPLIIIGAVERYLIRLRDKLFVVRKVQLVSDLQKISM